ncbi:cuticle protein 8-like [Adelges cooleyi]|uniref:cuticle protein 8-like n=1 Tax=Adelges cooleyi TaxID=133065 RepID=UPI0021805649|nr:cuticle protein 8-like [Adelges cooleyi]
MSGMKVCLLLAASVCLAYASDGGFAYGVSDPKTGDQKDQQEVRNGDTVSGFYRLLDADGSVRVVHYKADPVHGFSAEVKRQPAANGALPALTNSYGATPYSDAPSVKLQPAPASVPYSGAPHSNVLSLPQAPAPLSKHTGTPEALARFASIPYSNVLPLPQAPAPLSKLVSTPEPSARFASIPNSNVLSLPPAPAPLSKHSVTPEPSVKSAHPYAYTTWQ